jgi:calpain-15
MILEKAWAKLYGSYGRIEGGFMTEVLHDLTGAPTKLMRV